MTHCRTDRLRHSVRWYTLRRYKPRYPGARTALPPDGLALIVLVKTRFKQCGEVRMCGELRGAPNAVRSHRGMHHTLVPVHRSDPSGRNHHVPSGEPMSGVHEDVPYRAGKGVDQKVFHVADALTGGLNAISRDFIGASQSRIQRRHAVDAGGVVGGGQIPGNDAVSLLEPDRRVRPVVRIAVVVEELLFVLPRDGLVRVGL
jgi:hypothetical protein